MTQKYQVGEEVTVEFIGRITEIKSVRIYNKNKNGWEHKILYGIDSETREDLGVNIEESSIFPLPEPAEIKEEK